DEHDTQHHHHDLGGLDPHFWLDPMRVDHVAQQLAETFASADSAHAQDYRANARELTTKLADLHDDYHTGLAQCSGDTIVVSHEAYGYITAEYGLRQVGLSGVDPEAEPAPATLAKVKAVMDKYNVTTIFTENLIDSRAAEAFAAETGAKTAVLDPIENLADTDKDYLVLMEENLQELRKALQCR
ncbi:MAG: zinc ABC transporter substrate-binding protein, partial [Bowdeniella nasicola]|nr:zinc ABC transporter substrate-binding protein [Bowdeniella nasicola]